MPGMRCHPRTQQEKPYDRVGQLTPPTSLLCSMRVSHIVSNPHAHAAWDLRYEGGRAPGAENKDFCLVFLAPSFASGGGGRGSSESVPCNCIGKACCSYPVVWVYFILHAFHAKCKLRDGWMMDGLCQFVLNNYYMTVI
jgi:hypothetical protein